MEIAEKIYEIKYPLEEESFKETKNEFFCCRFC